MFFKTIWEESWLEGNKYTISTVINAITNWTTFTYAKMLMSISAYTVLWMRSSRNSWDEILSDLTIVKEGTKYARINDKKENVVITESGTMHVFDDRFIFQRIFIAGRSGGERGPEVFPISGGCREAGAKELQCTENISGCLNATNNSGRMNLDAGTTLIKITKGQSQGYRVYDTQGLASDLASQAGGLGAKTGLYEMLSERERIDGKPSKEPTPEWKCRIRRLTPTECERLQGFPDGWCDWGIDDKGNKIIISDTQKYRCLGNAVSTNVIARIISAWQIVMRQVGFL